MIMDNIRSFSSFLGKREDDPVLMEFFAHYMAKVQIKKRRDSLDAYVECKKAGICFLLKDDRFMLREPIERMPRVFRLDTVHFIPKGREPGYASYSGVLLPGVAFGDDRDSVHSKLGEPQHSQESILPGREDAESYPILDRYDFGDYNISFEYDADEHRLTLVSLSLYPDKKIAAD